MCMSDFEYLMEPSSPTPWDPALHKQCSCRGVEPGELVTIWTEMTEYEDVPCPVAPRDAWGNIHDDHECSSCSDGYYEYMRTNLETRISCEHCEAAAKVLNVWCDGQYGVGEIPHQLAEHWYEDSLYRSLPFGRLVVLAGHGWEFPQGKATVEEIKNLVEKSLAKVN